MLLKKERKKISCTKINITKHTQKNKNTITEIVE